MSILVLANIGNSDLTVDGQPLRRPRSEGEAAWRQRDNHRFAMPIIEPCMTWILNHHQHQRIDRVVLFYTDQPDTPETRKPDRYGVPLRDKDTVWCAQIIDHLLRERFGDQIGQVERQIIARIDGASINPSMYDEAFDAYAELVARLIDPQAETCYVLMTGGIPACNSALQLQAISAFGERCRVLYQPEGSVPYELRIGDQILKTFRRATAIEALERLDFATALGIVRQLGNDALIALVEHAHYRECFDFERAQEALNRAVRQASGDLRPFLAGLQSDLERLIRRSGYGRAAARTGRQRDDHLQERSLRRFSGAHLSLPGGGAAPDCRDLSSGSNRYEQRGKGDQPAVVPAAHQRRSRLESLARCAHH
jgi:hypothetical protein